MGEIEPKSKAMDVKGLVRNIIPLAPQAAKEARKSVKTDNATDRDPNGQSSQGGDQGPRRQFTQEELEEAVKRIEALPGFKDNGLRARLAQAEGVSVVYIEDAFGKVVRRIPEAELGALTAAQDKKSGHLLNKAM